MNLEELLELDEAKITVTEELSKRFGFESNDLIMIYGAITTSERFSRFTESLCHLCEDGNIRRFGAIIGSSEDIELKERPV